MKNKLAMLGVLSLILFGNATQTYAIETVDGNNGLQEERTNEEISENEEMTTEVLDNNESKSENELLQRSESDETVSTDGLTDNNETFSIKNLYYNKGNNALGGVTEPYAIITYQIQGTETGKVEADLAGNFVIYGNFSTGMIVEMRANLLDSSSAIITYTIPDVSHLIVTDITYDYISGVLSLKTVPNATVGIANKYTGGQGLFTADSEGNLILKNQVSPGQTIVYSVYLDGVTGETFEYTIPLQNTDNGSSNNGATSTNGTPVLPSTNSRTGLVYSVYGGMILLSIGSLLLYLNKRKFIN